MTILVKSYRGGPPDAELASLLEQYARIGITGGPRTGKTTLAARSLDRPILSTDAYREVPWADVPAAVIAACAPLPRFVIEGVQVPRALRKGLAIDLLIYLRDPLAETTKGQQSMAKGVRTVLDDWMAASGAVPELHR